MLKKGEEGEANRSEMWLLSAEERKREGLQHFVGRHVQPPQSSQRQDWARLAL